MSNFKILDPPSDAHDYVHIVLTLHLLGDTASYSLRIFAFYVQCLTVAGV